MKVKHLLAMLLALALLAVACGSDGADDDGQVASDDAPATDDSDAGGEDAPETSEGTNPNPFDIDAILAADLDNCETAPTGDPIRVGMAMDFGDVSGFADIPGSEAVTHIGNLINCSGGINGSPV